jgi:glycerol-3-phosphate dehydrogenase (NAD(P)+)
MNPAMVQGAVGVIGGGTWGLALAAAAARTGKVSLVHSRRALDGTLPRGVTQARELRELAGRARLIVLAVPSHTARDIARQLGDVIDGSHYVVHGIRGLAGDADLITIGDILREETPARRIGALGGPVLPDELAAGKPSVMVCGSAYPEVNDALREAFMTPSLRLYATDDLRGLEWASALVGCLAIGVGYAQAVGLGPGLIAALIARGVTEASKIAGAAGGEERTLLGLAGYGDLLASVEQHERPEVKVGRALAQGKKLEHALREAGLRVEAVELIPRVIAWADKHKVSVPVFTALARGVLAARPPEAIIRDLMAAPVEDRG